MTTPTTLPVPTATSRRGATTIRPVSPTELETRVPALTELLSESVNAGASLGFLPPLTHDEGRNYWLSIRSELQAGSRLLLAAYADGRIVGAGQLVFPTWSTTVHRAELQKIFVAHAVRGRGVGRSLIAALHAAAWQRGRSLLTLNTRRGERAERFYKELGYQEAGVLPGGTVGPAGERHDSVSLYQELSANGLDAAAVGRVGPFERMDSFRVYRDARARQAVAIAQVLASALRSVSAVVSRALATYRQQRHARDTYLALRKLDAWTLRDLGFDRSELSSVAAEVTGAADRTRARVSV
jgi:GNAT superfamily N-acetyltransferase/uncharacterized protein YjiS (DUF1127 family)